MDNITSFCISASKYLFLLSWQKGTCKLSAAFCFCDLHCGRPSRTKRQHDDNPLRRKMRLIQENKNRNANIRQETILPGLPQEGKRNQKEMGENISGAAWQQLLQKPSDPQHKTLSFKLNLNTNTDADQIRSSVLWYLVLAHQKS